MLHIMTKVPATKREGGGLINGRGEGQVKIGGGGGTTGF